MSTDRHSKYRSAEARPVVLPVNDNTTTAQNGSDTKHIHGLRRENADAISEEDILFLLLSAFLLKCENFIYRSQSGRSMFYCRK